MFRVAFVLAVVALTAGAPSWSIVNSDIAATDTGVAFISEKVGYSAGDANNVGPEVFKSVDGGAHFSPCNASFGIDLLLLDCDATQDSVVVSSVFGELYSDDDGKSFKPSRGGGTSQSVRYLGLNGDGGKKYGVTGEYGKREGVALSVDGGQTFKIYDAGLYTWARYGAFPNDTTWYVAAGSWPGSQAQTPAQVPTNARKSRKPVRPFKNRRSMFLNGDGTYAYPNREPTNDGFMSQISVTHNGGQTWTTVFGDNSTFYFNGIDCSPNNGDNCCAVGEGDDGARIYCTTNGGKSWNRTFWAPAAKNKGFSLLEIRFSNDTDAWAVGATLTTSFPSAWFVHTTDGGQTWSANANTFHGYYAMSVSMVDPEVGYAAADNLLTQLSSIFKYSSQ